MRELRWLVDFVCGDSPSLLLLPCLSLSATQQACLHNTAHLALLSAMRLLLLLALAAYASASPLLLFGAGLRPGPSVSLQKDAAAVSSLLAALTGLRPGAEVDAELSSKVRSMGVAMTCWRSGGCGLTVGRPSWPAAERHRAAPAASQASGAPVNQHVGRDTRCVHAPRRRRSCTRALIAEQGTATTVLGGDSL